MNLSVCRLYKSDLPSTIYVMGKPGYKNQNASDISIFSVFFQVLLKL